MGKKFFLFIIVSLVAATSFADVLILESGKKLQMQEYRVEGAFVHVTLNEKAQLVIPIDWVREIRDTPDPPPAQYARNLIQESMSFAYAEIVLPLSEKHNVDWRLVLSVMAVESNYNPKAVSPKGARGLMQLMPATAKLYDIRSVKSLYEPGLNIEAGVRHLKMLLDRYKGNLELVLAAYNAGEKAVERFGGIPPYAETRAYVKKVLKLYRGLSV